MPSRRYGLDPWFRMNVRYYHDERIGMVQPLAELLWVRAIGHSKASGMDGRVSLRELNRCVAIGMGLGLDDVSAFCKELVAAGLMVEAEEPDTFVVRRFVKWNETAEEISQMRAHDADRKRRERAAASRRRPDGRKPDTDRTPDGLPPESPRSPLVERDRERDRERERPSGPKGPDRTDAPRASAPPDLTGVRRRLAQAARNSRTVARQRTDPADTPEPTRPDDGEEGTA